MKLNFICVGEKQALMPEPLRGETAFRRSCQSCHSLPRLSMKSDDEWPGLVARYGQRAKLSEDKILAIVEDLSAANKALGNVRGKNDRRAHS